MSEGGRRALFRRMSGERMQSRHVRKGVEAEQCCDGQQVVGLPADSVLWAGVWMGLLLVGGGRWGQRTC
jgi:hypothetical protein